MLDGTNAQPRELQRLLEEGMPRIQKRRTIFDNDPRPRSRKSRSPIAGSGDISITLQVTAYSVREYPGRSSMAPSDGNYAGTALAYMILTGQAATSPPRLPVTAFFLQFVPDGLQLPQADYSPGEKAVEMVMNWCQFHPLLQILRKADSVQAIYTFTNGTPWADVEGQFTRK